MLCLAALASASEPLQTAFSYEPFNARVPVVREGSYVVNAKVRPLLLFWIGRDNVGEARLTWREDSGGRRTFEFLIGSDPARAPRRINRWGFIVEELNDGNAEVLGVMKQSNEETLEEAEAQIARLDVVSTFKAARTTITGSRAVSGVMTVHAPAHLTYREIDELLALLPAEPPRVRTLELPSGTQKGFLVAMDSLIGASVGPCRTTSGAGDVPTVPYLYNQTLYDLSLLSCDFEPELRTKTDTFADVVDGRFQIRNRTTKYETKFRVFYGTSGELRELPVRAVFRPRWWMEVELVLDRSAGGAADTEN
ncbi:MAG: hypothetical protein EHM89_05235 [Acidobacteria bacterium]|nr:MAG: hypothetical protein EHM89_05235 [Acidobacteriota bacterium]